MGNITEKILGHFEQLRAKMINLYIICEPLLYFYSEIRTQTRAIVTNPWEIQNYIGRATSGDCLHTSLMCYRITIGATLDHLLFSGQ